MWEHDLIKLYKGLFHNNPGGFTYTEGWSPLLRDYAEIMDENTRLREEAKQAKPDYQQYIPAVLIGLGGLFILGFFLTRKRP